MFHVKHSCKQASPERGGGPAKLVEGFFMVLMCEPFRQACSCRNIVILWGFSPYIKEGKNHDRYEMDPERSGKSQGKHPQEVSGRKAAAGRRSCGTGSEIPRSKGTGRRTPQPAEVYQQEDRCPHGTGQKRRSRSCQGRGRCNRHQAGRTGKGRNRTVCPYPRDHAGDPELH